MLARLTFPVGSRSCSGVLSRPLRLPVKWNHPRFNPLTPNLLTPNFLTPHLLTPNPSRDRAESDPER